MPTDTAGATAAVAATLSMKSIYLCANGFGRTLVWLNTRKYIHARMHACAHTHPPHTRAERKIETATEAETEREAETETETEKEKADADADADADIDIDIDTRKHRHRHRQRHTHSQTRTTNTH